MDSNATDRTTTTDAPIANRDDARTALAGPEGFDGWRVQGIDDQFDALSLDAFLDRLPGLPEGSHNVDGLSARDGFLMAGILDVRPDGSVWFEGYDHPRFRPAVRLA